MWPLWGAFQWLPQRGINIFVNIKWGVLRPFPDWFVLVPSPALLIPLFNYWERFEKTRHRRDGPKEWPDSLRACTTSALVDWLRKFVYSYLPPSQIKDWIIWWLPSDTKLLNVNDSITILDHFENFHDLVLVHRPNLIKTSFVTRKKPLKLFS